MFNSGRYLCMYLAKLFLNTFSFSPYQMMVVGCSAINNVSYFTKKFFLVDFFKTTGTKLQFIM